MNHISIRKHSVLLILVLAVLLFTTPLAHASSAEELDAAATATLTQFYEEFPAGRELAGKAAGLLIFPSIVKAGVIFGGGGYGEGVLRIGGHTEDYYNSVSASLGLQAGVQSESLVLLFMTRDALNDFRDSEGWEAGVDGSVTVVTAGVAGSIDTTTANQPIIGFMFGHVGFMGKLTLEGTKMTRISK